MTEEKTPHFPALERMELRQVTDILVKQYRVRATLKLRLANLDISIAFREQDLTPEGGKWPGDNVAERKVAMERTFSEDRELQALKAQTFVINGEIILLEGEIDGKLIAIKGLRWGTLSRLVEAMYRSQGLITVEGALVEDMLESLTQYEQTYVGNPSSLIQEEIVSSETPSETPWTDSIREQLEKEGLIPKDPNPPEPKQEEEPSDVPF